ncbi:protein PAT1 homolog 2 [Syngnathus acus]|uniref:protein PAT1 homolog 2 n=1 Tax=Syngnathus acus TaxID=161584 RepID=UPI001885CB49|nr:protein PAT1 homolog 2 [Syngnathus acus]
MSDSQRTKVAEEVEELQWPENGDKWSEGEPHETSMLLQAMAEDDEEINIHNEETFGMDVDAQVTPNGPKNTLLDFGDLPPLPTTPPPPDPKPSLPPSLPSPPIRVPHYCRGRGKKRGLGLGLLFEDPAVMKVVEGRPSLKSMDSAIVDCGNVMCHHENVSACFMPMMPGPPYSCRPLTQMQQYNQTEFGYPKNQPRHSTPLSLTPKMMQLRFGPDSPRLSPFYSTLSSPVQHFRYPDPVTQLHPHHQRILNQKQHTFQRKPYNSDPYCNLMTAKEKDWIIRLQMIQLQSENPYLEDYYYQEYYRRMEAKMAEEELGLKSKRVPPKLTTPYITKTEAYAPVVHIEGSLGQVAVSTCYSPRRAIGAVHAVQVHGPLEEKKDMTRQRLELLSEIEKLFIVLLEVEESGRTNAKVLSGPEERRLMEKTQRKVEQIYSRMQHHHALNSEGEFLPFLVVSKGKKLLARFLPFLKRDLAIHILRVITANLPTLMSRDTEENLPVLYPPLRNVIESLTFSQLIEILRVLTSSENLSTNECLSLACQNKFGISLLYALLSRGEKLLSSGVALEPSIGDFETWTDTIFQVAGQLSQCSLVEPLLLPSNVLTLFCRYLDKRTVHQLKSNMKSATGGLALPS